MPAKPVEVNTNTSTALPAPVSGLTGKDVIEASQARTAQQHAIVTANSGMKVSGGSKRSTKRKNKTTSKRRTKTNSKRSAKRNSKRSAKRNSKRKNKTNYKRRSKRGGAPTPTSNQTPTPTPTSNQTTVPAFKNPGATANSAAGNAILLKSNAQAALDNINAPATTTSVN
jgi:hypothetical protein